MAKRLVERRRVEPARQEEPPPPINEKFKVDQQEAFAVKLLAQELGITPGQFRSLKFAYGRDMAKIRAAAEQLRRS